MTRWARVARGTVAAVVSLFIAAFSHSLAGGALPGIAGISLFLVFSVMVCTALAGRRVPRLRLGISIVASQAMYHWLFGSLGATVVSIGGSVGHVHNAPIDFGAISTHVHSEGDMLLAHIAAAIATFAVLAFGERSIAATIQAARKLILSLFPEFTDSPLANVPGRLVRSGLQYSLPQHRRVDHSGLRHRGPPVAIAA
ncbi:MAG: hypothetical protein ABI238_00855 [Terrimesophilobacter sp.]